MSKTFLFDLFFVLTRTKHENNTARQSLGTKRITAKISTENKGSIQLFLTQLGFVQISYSQIFEEVTLEKVLSGVNTSNTTGETPGQDMLQVQFETLELDLKDLDL